MRLARLRRRVAVAPDPHALLEHASAEDRAIVERSSPYSMVGDARLLAVIDAVRYVTARGIEGDLVECGVWRGGAVLAMLLTLVEMGDTSRGVYLYDTFEGMTAPSERDVSPLEPPALETWRSARRAGERPWDAVFGAERFSEESVRELLTGSGYPPERLHLVRGAVEETLPRHAPGRLAVLRLDTDWYASTRHELLHLFPRLASGGVLLVDDYGHWDGARQAIEEYFSSEHPALLFSRIDYTGRIAVKH